MFSTEFQVASADHRKLDRELVESQADQAQAAKSQRQSSAADELVVAASSGAMPETFRDDSPSTDSKTLPSNSKKPPTQPQ